MIAAILDETALQQNYLEGESIETIYFGGGTPSLFDPAELESLLIKIRQNFTVVEDAEITMEANPDDISVDRLEGWKSIGINRLSIGIQSFFEEDLEWMNRGHNATQAYQCISLARQHGFENITIDLIYGTPLLSNEKWKLNVDTAISLNIPHLSCYALTVEPKTPLQKMITRHEKEDVDPEKQVTQFLLLMEWMKEAGYEHYEISNFAKPGWRSRHNSSYWQGKKYLGLGPSAHSYNGITRQWNISNNNIYIEAIGKGNLSIEKEELTQQQQLNEYIMTSLRTIEGLSLSKVEKKWGKDATGKIRKQAMQFIAHEKMFEHENNLILTNEGKLLADGIAASFFD